MRRCKKKRTLKKAVKTITTDYLPRLKKYSKSLKIIGNNRNSYSKTDTDATFMHMKEDHMRNGQLKPGYNVQVGTNHGFIVNWTIHQNRNDNGTLKTHLERYKKLHGKLPLNIGADSGYGNQENYEYLEKEKIKNYIKYPLFHKEQKASFKKNIYKMENLQYNEINNKFTCPTGKAMNWVKQTIKTTETGFKQEIQIYECENCNNCPHKNLCTKSEGNRQINFNKKLWHLKNTAKRNLLSAKGLQMRSNRAEYAERVFGQIKWNMGFKRFTLRGLQNVDIEWGLLCMAFNISKISKKLRQEVETISLTLMKKCA